jgi:hypothetical protein
MGVEFIFTPSGYIPIPVVILHAKQTGVGRGNYFTTHGYRTFTQSTTTSPRQSGGATAATLAKAGICCLVMGDEFICALPWVLPY